jgi:hypothetical protein
VYWPASETRQVWRDVAVDQFLEIEEGRGDYRTLSLHPVPFQGPGPRAQTREKAEKDERANRQDLRNGNACDRLDRYPLYHRSHDPACDVLGLAQYHDQHNEG